MITKELTNPTRQQTGSVLNLRLLGTLGILASPMIFVEGLLVGFEQHGTDQLIALLEVFYIIGWMSSIAGLRWVKATGQGRPGQAILVVQLVGLFLAGAWAAYHFVPNPNTTHFLYQVTDFSGHTAFNMLLIPFLGFYLGFIILAVAWWRARLVPLWVAIVIVAGLLSEFFGPEALSPELMWTLLLVGFGWIGLKLLRMSDTQWEHGNLELFGTAKLAGQPAHVN